MLAKLCSGTSGRPYTTLVGGRGKECIFWGSNFSIRKCSLKEIVLQTAFPWLVSGRQRDLGPPLKLKCLGIAGPYPATTLENFVGTSPVKNFTQPARQQWWRFSVSLAPLRKVLSTRNLSLCFHQPVGIPGNLSSASPAEKVVHPP